MPFQLYRCFLLGSFFAMLARAQAPSNGAALYRQATKGAVEQSAILDREIAVDFRNVSVSTAIGYISDAAKTVIAISATDRDLFARHVTLRADRITVRQALASILAGTGLRVEIPPNGGPIVVGNTVTNYKDSGGDQGSLGGTVTDSKTGERLSGVLVAIQGSVVRTAVTGLDGHYRFASLEDGNYTLSVRRLGYLPKIMAVRIADDSPITIDIPLVVSPATLDQIVTTVTGSRTKREMGNLIETIAADSIAEHQAVSDLSDVLNARAAGVQVFNVGGVTGASPDINIRGQNSFTVSNIPLLYIDGVRVENSTLMQSPISSTRAGETGRLNDIDPADIQSVEIVKGPSAATLYGTDAANGVILVTTRQGHAGGARWDLTGESGILDRDKSRLIDPYYAWGHTTGSSPTPVQCLLLQEAAGSCVIDSVTHFDPMRVPSLTTMATGYRDAIGLDVSGSVGAARYFVSGRYEDETAPTKLPDVDRQILSTEQGSNGLETANLRPNGIDRVPLHATFVSPLGRTVDISLSTSILTENARIPWAGADWNSASRGSGRLDSLDGWNAFLGRPAQLFAQRQLETIAHATQGATLNWRPLAWFTSHATGGYDFSYDSFDDLIPTGEGSPAGNPQGERSLEKIDASQITADVGATASWRLFSAVLSRTSFGGQFNGRTENDDQSLVNNLSLGTSTLAGGNGSPIVAEMTTETKTAGAYVQEEIGLNDRAYITGGLRADGAGTFGRAFNAAVYPKASATWLLSDEPFFPKFGLLNELRFRGAYGESGVQPGPTSALHTMTLVPVYVDGNLVNGAILQSVGNQNLKPERQSETEFGADIALFGERIKIEGTYYHKQSADALVSLPDAPQLGSYAVFNGTTEYNVGSVLNEGYELTSTVTLLNARAVHWDVTLNGSVNHNKLVRIAPGLDSIAYSQLHVGYSLFANFAQPVTYHDLNHDGIIEPNEVTVSPISTFRGNTYPTSQWSIGSTLGFLNGDVRLSALLDIRQGFVNLDPRYQQFQSTQAANDPHASLSDQAAYVAAYQTPSSSLWGYYERGDFTRLREIAISYTVPSFLSRQLHTRSVLLTLAARNIALWTHYRGADPETSCGGDGGLPVGIQGAYNNCGFAGPSATQYWILRLRLGL